MNDIFSSPEALISMSGAALSVLLTVAGLLPIPMLRAWVKSLDDDTKRLGMIIAMIAITFGSFGLTCWGWFLPYLPPLECTQAGFERVFVALLTGLAVNQGVWSVTPRGKKVETGVQDRPEDREAATQVILPMSTPLDPAHVYTNDELAEITARSLDNLNVFLSTARREPVTPDEADLTD